MRTIALLVALAAAAPVDAEPPPACSAPEHRQFDFWLGEWNVEARGKPAGHNRIVAAQNGCALLEHWTGARGNTGTSINAYDPVSKSWKQFWADSDGLVLALEGGLVEGAIVMRGMLGKDIQRVSWTPAKDGTIRQLWESSSDDGKTWSVQFDGLYRRDG